MADNWEKGTWFYRTCRFLVGGWLRCWVRLKVEGYEHIPATGACIVAANHASYLDPPVVGVAVSPRAIHFMARDSLLKWPLLGLIMQRLEIVPIDRDRGDLGALRRALAVLKEGRMLGLFPEGTRTRDGGLQPAKGGVGFLMARGRVPVVPVYVDGTYRAFPRGARFVRPRRVTVRFGKPISVRELEALGRGRDAYREAGRLIMDRIATLSKE